MPLCLRVSVFFIRFNSNCIIINSHTHGAYLDDPKFWDILAAAEALNVPIYIHPNTPSNAMIKPFSGVLTDTARLGIMRYFDGWNPQRYGVTNTAASATPSATRVMTAVDAFGNPAAPLYNPAGGSYTGAGLQCFSVFGTRRLDTNGNLVPFTAADCPAGSILLPPGGSTSFREFL